MQQRFRANVRILRSDGDHPEEESVRQNGGVRPFGSV